MIIERYSNKRFIQYILDSITSPARVVSNDIELGQELVALRNIREPEYISNTNNTIQNKFSPFGNLVLVSDGGSHVANAMGAGGIISTPEALMEYVRNWWLFNSGSRDLSIHGTWGFGGSSDGVIWQIPHQI